MSHVQITAFVNMNRVRTQRFELPPGPRVTYQMYVDWGTVVDMFHGPLGPADRVEIEVEVIRDGD